MQRLPGLRVPAPFAKEFPEQFVEMGIAEQSLVSTAAGMARCGLRPFAASPASFLSTRSMEQVKVDVAYSHTNVKLIGISGGISYGALGMTHHSAQDIAALASIPGLRVYLPSDRFLTQALLEVLVEDNDPATSGWEETPWRTCTIRCRKTSRWTRPSPCGRAQT